MSLPLKKDRVCGLRFKAELRQKLQNYCRYLRTGVEYIFQRSIGHAGKQSLGGYQLSGYDPGRKFEWCGGSEIFDIYVVSTRFFFSSISK